MPALTHRSFWFLRHGQTDWNAQNLAQGSVDIALNAIGLAQARDAARLLVGRGIASVIASPLSRARVTAEIVGEALGLQVQTDAGLQEVAFGTMEGQPMAADWFAEWIAGAQTPAGAESFADLQIRAAAAINRCLEQTPVVLVVAHGALFRALRAVMGLEPNVRLANAMPLFCEPGTPWTLAHAA
jgi:probable phosphoglycerate mutase